MDPQIVAILAALIALTGVLIGAIVTARGLNKTLQQTAAIEKTRRDREDARRHEEARRAAYPAFLALVDEGVLGISEVLGSGDPERPFARGDWHERMRESLAVIEFVGSPTAIDRAYRLNRAVQRLLVGASGVVTMSVAEGDVAEGDPMSFLDTLPYPLGTDVAPQDMYGGNHWVQVTTARTELRVRRQEYVNAARDDLGMAELPYPE